MQNTVRFAVDLLSKSKYTIALTGAGISTPSGIPDFRSHNSGLWEHANPMEVATIFGFKTRPDKFYHWVHPLVKAIIEAQPNPAHLALERMERAGMLKTIITQNIDLLHSRAGSKQVIEVHGSLREATCISCYTVYDARPVIEEFQRSFEVPRCPKCSGVLKPNVILFGEALPVQAFNDAHQAANRCEVMLVAGSSLEVAPVCDLPVKAHQRGAKVIIVNFEPTELDKIADVLIHDDVAKVLPQIADALALEAD